MASTALTVTLKRACGLRAGGAGLAGGGAGGGGLARQQDLKLPNAPALIVVAGLVLAVIGAVADVGRGERRVPAVLGVTERVFVPATSAALAGSVALASLEVMPTVSVELTGFQLASTALTVTLNGRRRSERTGRRSCRRRCRVRRSRRA